MVERLAADGHIKDPLVKGFFKHKEQNVDFTLVVDDFLVQHTHKEDLDHLAASVRKHHNFKVDEDTKQCVGISLNWDHNRQTVRLSMPGCIKQALKEFQHAGPSILHHAPSGCETIQCGQQVQFAEVDCTNPISARQTNHVQKVIGKPLYCARAVNSTVLH